ncbi:hypothetical protein K3495_g14424, partial [Podosphaera aphanis]
RNSADSSPSFGYQEVERGGCDPVGNELDQDRSTPLWVDRQLTLRPEFYSLRDDVPANTVEDSAVDPTYDSMANSDDSEQGEISHNDKQLISHDDDVLTREKILELKEMMRSLVEVIDAQEANGNHKFAEKVIETNESNRILMEELRQLNHRHTMPQMWARRRYPATMSFLIVYLCSKNQI